MHELRAKKVICMCDIHGRHSWNTVDECILRRLLLCMQVYALTKERDALKRGNEKLSDYNALLKEKDDIIKQVGRSMWTEIPRACIRHSCGNIAQVLLIPKSGRHSQVHVFECAERIDRAVVEST